jgi:hypothetical protein
MKRKNKKAFIQISFPWIFAIIVGIFILFLAIYGVTKLIRTEETLQSAKTSKEIGILLNPLETGFEEAKTSTLTFPVETRMYNKCDFDDGFGRQLIQVSQMSFNKWTETDIDVGFSNKYIFSPEPVEGKKFLIFTKPFDFPFKVADLTYITSAEERYCFISAPEDIEDEIKNLNQENLLVENCSELDPVEDRVIRVCFGGESDCQVIVNYRSKYVETRGGKAYFESDSLMYAAIFAGKNIYECQLLRLMRRVESLAGLYRDKIGIIGCGTHIEADLVALESSAKSLESSANLASANFLVEDINRKNKESSQCRLW